MLDITPLDRTELYMEAVLRLPLVLGKEYCHGAVEGGSGGGARAEEGGGPLLLRPVDLLCHERSSASSACGGCAAVDWVGAEALGLAGAPPAAAGGGAAGVPAQQQPPYYLCIPKWQAGESDFSLFLLAELVREYAAWRAARVAGGAGDGGGDSSGSSSSSSGSSITDFLLAKQRALGRPQASWAGATRGILVGVAQALRRRVRREAGAAAVAVQGEGK
jgi:hypothetical protein